MEPYQAVSQLFVSTNAFERTYASCARYAHLVVRSVSYSLEGFCEFAELVVKVYLSMESKIGGFPQENQNIL